MYNGDPSTLFLAQLVDRSTAFLAYTVYQCNLGTST